MNRYWSSVPASSKSLTLCPTDSPPLSPEEQGVVCLGWRQRSCASHTGWFSANSSHFCWTAWNKSGIPNKSQRTNELGPAPAGSTSLVPCDAVPPSKIHRKRQKRSEIGLFGQEVTKAYRYLWPLFDINKNWECGHIFEIATSRNYQWHSHDSFDPLVLFCTRALFLKTPPACTGPVQMNWLGAACVASHMKTSIFNLV